MSNDAKQVEITTASPEDSPLSFDAMIAMAAKKQADFVADQNKENVSKTAEQITSAWQYLQENFGVSPETLAEQGLILLGPAFQFWSKGPGVEQTQLCLLAGKVDDETGSQAVLLTKTKKGTPKFFNNVAVRLQPKKFHSTVTTCLLRPVYAGQKPFSEGQLKDTDVQRDDLFLDFSNNPQPDGTPSEEYTRILSTQIKTKALFGQGGLPQLSFEAEAFECFFAPPNLANNKQDILAVRIVKSLNRPPKTGRGEI